MSGSQQKIARRYARGLLLASTRADEGDVCARFFKALVDIPGAALASPLVSDADKVQALSAALPDDARVLRGLFAILMQNRRLAILPEIAAQYLALRNVQNNIPEAQVKTAHPLSEQAVAQISQLLEKKLGKVLRIAQVVDKNLLAGFTVQVDSLLVDASLAGQLQRLKDDLLTTQIAA